MIRLGGAVFRRWGLTSLVVLSACAADRSSPRSVGGTSTAAAPARGPNPKAPRAPFLVAIVVDQLSAWVAEERLPLLPESGGFARLRREGIWLKSVRFPYAVTDTAPGHASLHTGKTPSESGIWGNEVPDPARGGRVTFLRDSATRLVTPDGVLTEAGSSPSRLRVPTIADRLRKAHPDALTISISLKDRGAIMAAGQSPSHALWFDRGVGAFVTSTAYADRFPQWAAPLADARAVERARAVPWTVSDPGWLKRNVTVPDDAPGEGDLEGLGTTFPHRVTTSYAFRAAPASDKTIFDLALAGVVAEHTPTRPTLLLLSMSASDIGGHVFGPDSWEAWDQLYKLDAALGAFLDELERRVGRVAVVLSADHGNSSMPEVVRARRPASCSSPKPPSLDRWQRPLCERGVRIEPSELNREIRAELTRDAGPGDWFAGIADPYVFLTPRARSADPEKRAAIDRAVRRVFERRKEAIAEVYDVRRLAETCPGTLAAARGVPDRARAGEDVLTLVCRSWMPDVGAGDFYIVPKLGSVFDGEVVPGKGASHGGPWLHDRTVPMLIRAEGLAGEVVAAVDFSAYAAVAASLLGLDSRSVPEILRKLEAKPDGP